MKVNPSWLLILSALLFLSSRAGEMQQKGYLQQWQNEMRLYGTHPDTIKMFLDAGDIVPMDTARGFEGSFIPNMLFKRFSNEGQVGWLCECVSRKKVAENGNEYWEYVVRTHKVFDARPKEDK